MWLPYNVIVRVYRIASTPRSMLTVEQGVVAPTHNVLSVGADAKCGGLWQVVRRLEAYTHIELAKLETKTMLRTLNAFKQAIFLCDVASRGWPVLHANDALLGQLGGRPGLPTASFLALIHSSWRPLLSR